MVVSQTSLRWIPIALLAAAACSDAPPGGQSPGDGTQTPPGTTAPGQDAGNNPVVADAGGTPSADAGSGPVADAGSPSDAGTVTPPDPPQNGPVTYQGGTVDLVKFTVFGDIRPAIFEFDNQYPDDIVREIAAQMDATPAQFALGVGDYMFSFSTGSVNRQLDKLIAAERPFRKPIFHAMGNHECWGPTSVNCPNLDESPNVRLFMSRLFTFAQKPWHDFTVKTSKGDAKFVLIAQNAWTDEQKTWLERVLARPTTYTFIVRHQPSSAWTTPGIGDCDRIIAAHPYTLLLVGHDHVYKKVRANEVISGNGGAPLEGGHFGYLYVEQLDSGLIRLQERRKGTDQVDDEWKIDATGTAVP